MLLLSSFTGYFLGIERNLGGVLLGKEKMQLESLSNFVLFFLVLSPMTIWGDFFSTIGKIFVLRIIGYCIGIVIKLWFLRGHFLRVKLKLKLKMFMETKYYWFTGLSETALREADILILSFFIDGALLGAYFLALRIYFSFGILAEVISTSLTPFLSKCYVNKKSGGFYRFNKYMLFLFMVFSFIFSATLFFSRNLIVKLFSPEFLHYSGKYLFFLSFILFFRFFSFSTGIILSSSDLQRTRSNIMFSASILIIVLNVILGYYFNVSGVIISRAFIELLIFFLFGFFVNKIALKHDQDRQE
ncbi:MAG: MATE family efflux transporter [Acidobacteriota bacterium]